MNWEQIQSKWQDYKGQVKQRWAKLTDDDLTVVPERKLAALVLARDEAECVGLGHVE